jgi:hypothetical protein
LRQKIQIVLVVAMVAAGLRVAWIFYDRRQEKQATSPAKPTVEYSLSRDYYVNPKKLYPSDVQSARQLTKQPAWVKEGFRYTYYPYDTGTKRIDFSKEAGQLGPIQKLTIKDVVTDRTPGDPGARQILALFVVNGRTFAVPIGYSKGVHTLIYSDEMFYVQDPHELYRHWPSEIWEAIENHQVKPGMNELQADFAIGFGIPDDARSALDRTVRYSNGGKPMTVIYRDGKAVEVKQG